MAEQGTVVKANPFGNGQQRTGGMISIEQQRAVAQVQAAMLVARSMPRDRKECLDLILQDCTDPGLAEDAEYEFSRGGSKISGPSIRLLETVARRYGNMESGVKELSRQDGYSECEAFAVDYETGYRDSKTFQIKHWRDTKQGGYQLTDERDIYETLANSAARRKRACMEAVIPRDVIDQAMRQCQMTLKAKIEITPDFIKALLKAFEAYGVTQAMIEKRIQRHIDAMTPALAVQLKRIHNSLKDGMSSAGEWFDLTETAEGAAKPQTGTGALKEAMNKKKAGPTAGEAPKVEDGKPEITFEGLLSKIAEAKTLDDLDTTHSMVGEIKDQDRRNTLTKEVNKRRAELSGEL